MKKLLLSAAIVAAGFTASAQETGKPMHIKLNIGAASSMGDFKSTDMDNEKAGFAKSGALISLGVSQDLHKNFALGLTLGARNNPIDAQAAADAFAEGFEADTEVEAESFRTAFLAVDAIAQLPLNQVTLYGKASLGLARSTQGAFSVKLSDDEGNTFEMEQSEAKSTAPIFGLGAGARYDFGKFGLGIEAGLLSTTPEFEVEYDGETEKYKQPMTSFNTTITLAYRIK